LTVRHDRPKLGGFAKEMLEQTVRRRTVKEMETIALLRDLMQSRIDQIPKLLKREEVQGLR
jgi:hypothetical protein